MKPSDMLPILRHIEVVPLGDDEQPTFLLRDPQQLADRSLSVTAPVLFCMQCFDGATQVATLMELWCEASEGQALPLEELASIIQEMDEVFLLRNERSQERMAEVRREFAASPARTTRYQGETAEVADMLNAMYRDANLAPPDETPREDNQLALLIAPHIDYARGENAWPLAYSKVKKHFAGDIILLLGTNHQFHEYPLALTRKSYQTPLGEVQTDVALVEELAAALPFDAFADEFSHRDEHSIELAATMLKHLHGDQCPAIVPVLCGSFDEFLVSGVDPHANPVVREVCEALRKITQRFGERMTVIASVDFAHIGPQFGDLAPVSDEALERCLEQDAKLLRIVTEGNAQAFAGEVVAERNTRHVCGVAAIYFGLSCVPAKGVIESSLHYWKSDDGYGAVTFAVAALKRQA